MSNNGWIKLHRQFIDWEWYSDQKVKAVFLHCLLLANVEDKEWRGVVIKRGSFITSIDSIASATKLSFQSIRTALDKLKKTSEINIKTTNQYTYVTICKYNDYQDSGIGKQQTNNKPITNEQQTDNKRITTTKEYKNIRIEEVINKPDWALDFTHFKFDLIYPFEYPEFGNAWDLWLNYKKEQHRFSYKKIGEQAALKDLTEMSGGNLNYAIELINGSIAKSWKGIYKQTNGNGTTKRPIGQPATSDEDLKDIISAFFPNGDIALSRQHSSNGNGNTE